MGTPARTRLEGLLRASAASMAERNTRCGASGQPTWKVRVYTLSSALTSQQVNHLMRRAPELMEGYHLVNAGPGSSLLAQLRSLV